MTKREVAILACRVLAIYAIILFVAEFPSIIYAIFGSMVHGTPNWVGVVLTVVGPAMLLILAAYLWKRAGIIAAWIFSYDIQDEPNEPDSIVVHASMSDVMAVVLSLIGIWLTAHSVVAVTQLAVNHLLSVRNTGFTEWWSINIGSTLAGQFVQLLLGLWLIFGSRRIVTVLYQARNIGLQPTDDRGPSESSSSTCDND